MFEKRLKCMENDVDMWEMAKICLKWLNYLSINWEMIYRFGKWQKYLGNGVDIWGRA